MTFNTEEWSGINWHVHWDATGKWWACLDDNPACIDKDRTIRKLEVVNIDKEHGVITVREKP